MNQLLIIGAGGHGKVVAEIAKDLQYENIAFLDDNSPEAIGRVDDLEKFKGQYKNAFVGIGNNELRRELICKLQDCGYTIPVLIHPSAYVSKTAVVGIGTVVEPKAIVNANSQIGEGCIVSVGAIIDHDVKVGEFCHINAGAIVKAGAEISNFRKLEAGEIVRGYEVAAIKPANSNEPFAKEYLAQTGQEISFF
jgi:UDP-N-acetylbacillosamine N-acetyltransferase